MVLLITVMTKMSRINKIAKQKILKIKIYYKKYINRAVWNLDWDKPSHEVADW